ncbi:MAG: MlaD family protein [Prevotella sp.]
MKLFTKEVKIALVAIVGIVILFFGLNFLKGLSVFSSTNKYYIAFDNISGLSSSSPIYADGYQVGVVEDVIYDYSHRNPVKVMVGIDKQMRIPAGSKAEIVSDMLGNVQVNLKLSNNLQQIVEPGGTITGTVNNGAMGQLSSMIPTVERMLPKLDSIMASLNTILADPAVIQSLHNIQATTQHLANSTAQLNTLIAGLNSKVPAVIDKADKMLDNTNTIAANLATVDIAQTMEQVDKTIENLKLLSDKLNSDKGTLGLLLNDPQLYNNLNLTMESANNLVTDLKQHPKRYVHFSIFGKKDKPAETE